MITRTVRARAGETLLAPAVTRRLVGTFGERVRSAAVAPGA